MKNIIKKQIKKIEIAILTMSLLISQAIPAFAAIDGNTIQRNLINNVVLPLYTVLFVFILVKEFNKKNMAALLLTAVIGGIIGIFIYNPDAIKGVIDFMSSLIGI
ncbi:TcpD family membrane protein [Clostridium cuniculi]|uniref:TcpD family membrane protein n=1 Tax=Clostridium cuniculi TaxID=2548455 RepID=UPI001056DB7A|nr:TcpD family membrane protein [Clostridium cuniculi]